MALLIGLLIALSLVITPAPALSDAQRTTLTADLKNQLADEALSEYVLALQKSLGTHIYEDEFKKITGANAGDTVASVAATVKVAVAPEQTFVAWGCCVMSGAGGGAAQVTVTESWPIPGCRRRASGLIWVTTTIIGFPGHAGWRSTC
jgi:hypothetical protein